MSVMQSRRLSAIQGLLIWRNNTCPLYRRVFHCTHILLSYANMSRCMHLLLEVYSDLLFRLPIGPLPAFLSSVLHSPLRTISTSVEPRIAARVNDAIIVQTCMLSESQWYLGQYSSGKIIMLYFLLFRLSLVPRPHFSLSEKSSGHETSFGYPLGHSPHFYLPCSIRRCER